MFKNYLLLMMMISLSAFSGDDLCIHKSDKVLPEGKPCVDFGPQSPRDIDSKAGTNSRVFSFAPDHSQMNLCNIHFHLNSEHKAKAYAAPGAGGEPGFQCTDSGLPRPKDGQCPTVGSTIEVHWVYTSCNLGEGAGLAPCVTDAACGNASLRVEAQVYVLTDKGGEDFADFTKIVTSKEGYRQVTQLPDGSNTVTYHGSTTGPSYDEATCSPLQVTWNVREECAKLNFDSLVKWSRSVGDGAHASRELVVDPRLLSKID